MSFEHFSPITLCEESNSLRASRSSTGAIEKSIVIFKLVPKSEAHQILKSNRGKLKLRNLRILCVSLRVMIWSSERAQGKI